MFGTNTCEKNINIDLGKVKILLFIDCLGAGGAQRQLVGLASQLKERNYDVRVVVYHDIPFYLPHLEKAGVPCDLIAKGKPQWMRFSCFNKYVKEQQPDWVVAYLESPSIIACYAHLFNRKVSLIVSERNTSQKINWKERLRFNLFRLADYVVPNAFSQQKFMEKYAPYLSKKIRAITNFVDTEHFVPIEGKKRRTDVQEIVIAASIWPPKNTLNFINAVELLTQKTTNFHISWYGKNKGITPYVEECERLIEEKRLQQYISLLSKTPQIREKYQDADLFCLPSFYEGTPNVIGEAIACGLPVVCSNVCDNPIYVKEGVNGFLFEPKCPQDMADKLYKALTMDEDTYNYYAKQSRLTAETALLKDKFINNYIKLF